MAVADLLRGARERRGLTLEQMANETKIGVDHLAAFERDEVRRDGGFYERARLRSYAQALGLDYRVVLEQLDQEIRAAAPAAVPEPPAPPRRFRVSRAALTAIGCVLLIATAWLSREPRESVHAVVVPPPLSRAPQPVAAAIEDRGATAVVVAASEVIPPESTAITPAGSSSSGVVERTPVPVETSGVSPQLTPTSLVIVTEPEGARVTVDGIGWGTTPVTITNLAGGLKRIRVTSDGHAAVERVVDVQSDQVNRVALQLPRLEHDAKPTP